MQTLNFMHINFSKQYLNFTTFVNLTYIINNIVHGVFIKYRQKKIIIRENKYTYARIPDMWKISALR